MKKFVYLLLLVSLTALADECKVTTVTIERNGKVESETATVCKEGQPIDTKIRIGDTILESEVGRSKMDKYFTYRNSRCRMFTEHMAKDKLLRVYHGVICQIDNSETNWIVIDKW